MLVSPLSDFSYLSPPQGWGVGQSQSRDSTQGSGRPLQAEEARLNLVTLVGSTPTQPLQEVGITCLSVVAVSHPLGLGN